MALSNGMAYSSVVIGFMLLALTFGCIAGGGVALSELDNVGEASIGLWAIYFLLPAIICLVAGFGRYITLFAVAIGVNVFGALLALSGFSWGAAFWAILNSTCTAATIRLGLISINVPDLCMCVLNSKTYSYDISCSDLETVRDATAAITILYVLLLIVSVVGSILGCAGACCKRRDYRGRMHAPAYVVPYGNPNTMMMTRVEERRYFDNDPYPNKGRNIQQPTYYQRESYIDDRGYMKPDPYIEDRGYVQERHYNHDARYPQERPSYLATRALPPPGRDGHHLFAGNTNDDVRGGYYEH